MNLSRRKFFAGLAAAIAAPAIVKASSLMPIKAVKVMPEEEILRLLQQRMADAHRVFADMMAQNLYSSSNTFSGKQTFGLASLVDEQPKYMLVGKNTWDYFQNQVSVTLQ